MLYALYFASVTEPYIPGPALISSEIILVFYSCTVVHCRDRLQSVRFLGMRLVAVFCSYEQCYSQ